MDIKCKTDLQAKLMEIELCEYEIWSFQWAQETAFCQGMDDSRACLGGGLWVPGLRRKIGNELRSVQV